MISQQSLLSAQLLWSAPMEWGQIPKGGIQNISMTVAIVIVSCHRKKLFANRTTWGWNPASDFWLTCTIVHVRGPELYFARVLKLPCLLHIVGVLGVLVGDKGWGGMQKDCVYDHNVQLWTINLRSRNRIEGRSEMNNYWHCFNTTDAISFTLDEIGFSLGSQHNTLLISFSPHSLGGNQESESFYDQMRITNIAPVTTSMFFRMLS